MLQLSETEFWQRFFSSKLWNQIRASSRQAGDSIKDDAIFDKYLGIEEEGSFETSPTPHAIPIKSLIIVLEQLPKNLDTHTIYKLLDLAATQEDHGEVRNT